MKSAKYWLLAIIFTLPAFGLMLRPGIYTMHDPHLFRVQQFDTCFRAGNFPCRWAPDSGKGFGEPLFNFYAQFPYWLTQTFRLTGASLIDSLKLVFILSLIASSVAMYFLAARYWGRLGGLTSAVVYVFAPYRAVDVWVRGALPEALAFVFYPLILLFLDIYLSTKKTLPLVLFSVSLALLITTHNLSFIMFAPFLLVFWAYRTIISRDWNNIFGLIPAGILTLFLSAYYLLPVLLESNLVTLNETITGYYDYRIHFATLKELFISRYWGYGASLWAQKFLSISIGQVQWLLPVGLTSLLVFSKVRRRISPLPFVLFVLLGFIALFLTHGKSSVVWNNISFMKYIQFPWRYLTVAVFFLSLSAGALARFTSKRTGILIPLALIIAILTNYAFFRPDIWRTITDAEVVSGPLWDEGRSSSLTDFWPKTALRPPDIFASLSPQFVTGSGSVLTAVKYPSSFTSTLNILSDTARISFPIAYFPGWEGYVDNKSLYVFPDGDLGLITAELPVGQHEISLKFVNTPPRTAGNLISLTALLSLPLWFLKKRIG